MTTPVTESEPLPTLYARWIGELLGGPIPREHRASCDNCAMAPSASQQPGARSIYFDPAVKCCTYLPELHNFLVGRILKNSDPATQPGRTTVEKRISDGIAVTPLGLSRAPVYSLLYNNSEESFGRSRSLKCPHYLEDEGRCGIWLNRESTCATWFCKHVRGNVGYTFWRSSLHRLLFAVERTLARWCVLELDMGSAALRHLVATPSWTWTAETVTGESLDSKVNHESYARLWGNWLGRERDFFSRCADLVDPLSWSDVLAVCGPEVRAYAELTREAHRDLTSNDIPAALSVGSMQLVQIENGMTRLKTYSVYDPIDVPRIVMELLHYFDGRPTAEALAAVAKEKGARLEPDLIRKMVDFGLLVPSRPPQ